MGAAVWVLGGIAAVIGLAVGYWWAMLKDRSWKREVAAKDEAVRDHEVIARGQGSRPWLRSFEKRRRKLTS